MPPRRRRRRPRTTTAPRSFFRRRSTLWLIAAIATLAVGIVLGAIAGTGGGDDAPEPTPTLASGVPLPELAPDESRLTPAEVVGVIDGDTIDVEIAGERERVRYYGVDTPERGEPCYREATARNEQLIADGVLLLPDARDRDRSGRLLRYAFTADGVSIEARLIAEGLGAAWPEDGAYRNELLALEAAARAAGAGCLWGAE
jgi:endonuclease YncB( thermonuclease family)